MQPQGCTGASLGCPRARDICGTFRPSPEKTTCCFPYRFSEKNRNSGLVPGNWNPKPGMSHELCRDVPDPWGAQKACAKKQSVLIALAPTLAVSHSHPVPSHTSPDHYQRRRDDNKNKIFTFEGAGPWGQRGKSSKNAGFRGKRHDNNILKVQIVIAQAPRNHRDRPPFCKTPLEGMWTLHAPSFSKSLHA